MRTAHMSSRLVAALAMGAVSLAACAGRVEPGTGGGSSGTGGTSGSASSGSEGSSGSSTGGSSAGTGGSSGSGWTSGSPGDPECSGLAVPDIARICPDGSAVGGRYVLKNHQCVLEFPCPSTEPGGCTDGASCSQGSACGGGSSGGCSTACMCDSTSHYVCATSCTSPDPCSQGAACSPGSGCGTASGSVGSSSGSSPPPPQASCSTNCMCDSTGHMQCQTNCTQPPIDPCQGYSLPNTCEVCSDGTTQCEHFAIINGQCAIEICPGAPSPMIIMPPIPPG